MTGLCGNLGKLTKVKLTLEEAIKAQWNNYSFLNSVLGGVGHQYQRPQTKTFCVYVWSTQGNQIPRLTGRPLIIGIYTLSFPLMKENFHKTGMPEDNKFILLLNICNAHSHEFYLQKGNILFFTFLQL
jgi:hypothetical protein